MAWDVTDWSFDRQTGNIRYEGDLHGGASPSYVSGIEWYREISKFGDNLVSSGDDEYDMTDDTFGARSTDTIFTLLGSVNIDQASAEHIYDATISQNGGDDRWDSVVNYGNPANIQIMQDGALITNDFWNEFGSSGFNPDIANGISHRFLVQVRTGGADIDGRRLLGMVREFGYTYSEFPINGTNPGLNTLALKEADDLNNNTIAGTVSGWNSIVNDKEGYSLIDANGDGSNEPYYSDWEFGSQGVNDFFERLKWLTRRGTAETIYGLAGDVFRGITHQVVVSSGAGTWVEPESLSWGTGATAGTGQLLAVDNTAGASATKLWLQLLTGVPPNANEITGNGGATGTAGTVTDRTIVTPFVGSSTGTAIVGSYGLGIGSDDLTASDKVTDLDGTLRLPPNNVTVTVGGLVATEDTVILTNYDAVTNVDYDQFVSSGGLTTDNITSLVISTGIPSDTPSTGYVRIADDNGFRRRLHYSGWDTSTFDIDSTDGQEDFAGVGAASGNDVYIEYISEEATGTEASVTYVYSADRTFWLRVRDGGSVNGTPTKTYETTVVGTSTGATSTAIRTPDA